MKTLILAVGLVLVAMLALGVGLLLGRPPLERSCGAGRCDGACGGCDRSSGDAAR